MNSKLKTRNPKRETRNRRISERKAITVLVKCGGVNMEARDIAHDGVRLHWTRKLALSLCPKCNHSPYDKVCDAKGCLCSQKMTEIKVGQKVNLDDLVYTDKGSEPILGKVCWVKKNKKSETCDVGVKVTTPGHRTHFKALESFE